MEGTTTNTGPPVRGSRGLATALLFLLAGLLPTFVAVRALSDRQDRQAEAVLEEDARIIADTVKRGLDRYIDTLYSTRGLFSGSERVTRAEWKHFYDSQEIAGRLPGISSLRVLERVTADERDAFVASVRDDRSRDPEGYPDFRITPPGERPEYYVVAYVEPLETERAAFGFDAFSDPVLRAEIEHARDTGAPAALSERRPKDGIDRMVVFVPFYLIGEALATADERRVAVGGMVSATFDAQALFTDLLGVHGERTGKLLDVEVHEAGTFDPDTGSSRLFHRPGDLAAGGRATRIRTESVPFADHDLVLVLRAHPDYGQDAFGSSLPIVTAIFGTLLPLAAFTVFLALDRSRKSAWRVALGASREVREKSKQLAESNRRLEEDIKARTGALDQKIAELEGSKTAILNVLEDLTLAKEDLESAQAYDRALLASIADGVIAVDTGGIITEVNEAALRLLERSRESLVGKPLATALPLTDESGATVPADQRLIVKALRGAVGQVFTDSEHYYTRHGERFPVTLDTAPIVMAGRVQGAIEVFRDITREKEVDRAKSEFVSLASHQLRTPLTAIGWYTELLLSENDANLTPEQRSQLSEVNDANRRMVDLVDALLNVSRLELGTLVIALEPTPVKELVRRVVAQFAIQISEHHLRVDEKYPDAEVTVMTDPRLFAVVVENLVSNAIKYSPPESPVTIAAQAEGDQFVLSVTDKGIGIPAAQQQKLFTKLFRADNARLSDTDGTGLGLYLAKSIVDRLGGAITFTSEEGKGSSFMVRIPIAGPPQPPPSEGGAK